MAISKSNNHLKGTFQCIYGLMSQILLTLLVLIGIQGSYAPLVNHSNFLKKQIITWIIIWIFCGIISAIIANSKGRSGCAWFLLGVLLGPFGFAVALLPRVEPEGQTKKCPYCAEMIKQEAIVCRFCGKDLPAPTIQPLSEIDILEERLESLRLKSNELSEKIMDSKTKEEKAKLKLEQKVTEEEMEKRRLEIFQKK